MANVPPGAPPPYEPEYRRYWGYYNRPYTGCGCLWTILLIILIWWIISAFFYTPARFGWW